jgi:hypothetical protein
VPELVRKCNGFVAALNRVGFGEHPEEFNPPWLGVNFAKSTNSLNSFYPDLPSDVIGEFVYEAINGWANVSVLVAKKYAGNPPAYIKTIIESLKLHLPPEFISRIYPTFRGTANAQILDENGTVVQDITKTVGVYIYTDMSVEPDAPVIEFDVFDDFLPVGYTLRVSGFSAKMVYRIV